MNEEELKAVLVLKNYLMLKHNVMCKLEINYDGVKVVSDELFIPSDVIEWRVNKK